MSCCANHTCAKSLNLNHDGGDANVLCPLCVDTQLVYCSEECRVMDWVKHKCDNAFMIKGRAEGTATALVPYHFEDTLDEKEYKRLQETISPEQLFQMENQHFLVQTVSHDNTLKQQMIAASLKPMDPKLHTVYRRGKKPDDRLDDISYAIELSAGDTNLILEGKIGADSIHQDQLAWLETKPGKLMSWLLDRRKESSSVVLFPRVTALPEDRAFPTKGTMSIKVTVNGKTVNDITDASYTMRTHGYEWTRAMGKFLTPRLKALFPGKEAAIKDMKMLRLQEGSTSLVLIFNVPRMEAESMRLEGVVYTVSETNLLRKAFGPAVVQAGKPPSVSTPKKKAAVAPAIVKVVDTTPAPLEYDNPSSLSDDEPPLYSPPLPRRDDDTNAPSSLPSSEIEEGKSRDSIPPSPPSSSPPPPPRPQPTLVVPNSSSQNRRSFSAEDFQKKQLRKTPTNSDDKKKNTAEPSNTRGFNTSMVEAAQKRRAALGEDDDDDETFVDSSIMNNELLKLFFSSAAGSISMDCDASNLAHVTGLAMALEYRAATGDARVKTADMEHVTSIIQEYARNPHFDAAAAEVPLHVSTAIYTALDVLSQ